MLYAVDFKWWEEYGDEARRTRIRELWTADQQARDAFRLSWVRGEDGHGLSTRDDCIYTAGNSGHQAIGLAYLFGARRIVLLGYDFQKTGGRNHWHADHPERLGNLAPHFDGWRDRMSKLAAGLVDAGVPVENCSRATSLDCFPRVDLAEALS